MAKSHLPRVAQEGRAPRSKDRKYTRRQRTHARVLARRQARTEAREEAAFARRAGRKWMRDHLMRGLCREEVSTWTDDDGREHKRSKFVACVEDMP